jgi:CheY-like chemotaxis protein
VYTLGATEYLTKPVDRQRLSSVLRRLGIQQPNSRVLIVDDDPVTRDVLRSALTEHAAEVYEATDGRAALEGLREFNPGLILLDLMMPSMDGFEFIEHLRRDPERRKIPVVVLTAKDLSIEERERLNGSVERIFRKPEWSREALLEELQRFVEYHPREASPPDGTTAGPRS